MARQRDIIEIEQWKDVPGWGGYQASSMGRIRRIVPEATVIFSDKPNRGHGYADVVLRKPDGTTSRKGAHVIVCSTFHGPRPSPGHEAAHNDGTRTNNRPDNLRWATKKENAADRVIHGTNGCGERLRTTTLTADDVLAIRADYRGDYGDLVRIAKKYDVTRGSIWRIVRRKNWKHI